LGKVGTQVQKNAEFQEQGASWLWSPVLFVFIVAESNGDLLTGANYFIQENIIYITIDASG
jgi:hypothetical protein